MKIVQVTNDTDMWSQLIKYAKECSWEGVGEHLAEMMNNNCFSDWETVFCAWCGDRIVGFCTFLKTDFYPENRYSPWISTIFVDEEYRGQRISHLLIEATIGYARKVGFKTVYIPSDMVGFYEKCGFTKIDELKNYAGSYDNIFSRGIE